MALKRVAGEEALKLVTFKVSHLSGRLSLLLMYKDDPTNRRIVGSWPAAFDNSYPLSLGFIVDEGNGGEEAMVPIVQRFKDAVEAGLA
jgi:hypothetical protein